MQQRWFIWRYPLGGLLVFELLTLFGILPYHTYFTITGLVLTCAAVWCTLELIQWRISRLPVASDWLLQVAYVGVVLAIYADAIGDYAGWYGAYQYYDTVLHLFISAALALYVWNVYGLLAPAAEHTIWLVATTVISCGVVYEIEEYLEDVVTGSHRLGDGFDTANDLLMDVLGAVAFAIFVYFARQRRQRQQLDLKLHRRSDQKILTRAS